MGLENSTEPNRLHHPEKTGVAQRAARRVCTGRQKAEMRPDRIKHWMSPVLPLQSQLPKEL